MVGKENLSTSPVLNDLLYVQVLQWEAHIDMLLSKANTRVGFLCCNKAILDSSPNPGLLRFKRDIFFLLPVVLFIDLDSFGVSCLVLEI